MVQTKGELTREKILSEASLLFNQKGFGATTVSDVVAATGLKKGSLYFHFPGKDALGISILEKAREEFMVFLETSLTGKTPGKQLDNFLKNVLKKQSGTGFVGGCIFGNTALEMSDKDERYSNLIEQVFHEWMNKIEHVVQDAQASGQVRDDLPAKTLARHIVSAIEGNIMLARVEKNEKLFKGCLNAIRKLIGLRL